MKRCCGRFAGIFLSVLCSIPYGNVAEPETNFNYAEALQKSLYFYEAAGLSGKRLSQTLRDHPSDRSEQDARLVRMPRATGSRTARGARIPLALLSAWYVGDNNKWNLEDWVAKFYLHETYITLDELPELKELQQ